MLCQSASTVWLLPLLVGAVAIPVQGRNTCQYIDCQSDCNELSSTYQPQRCDSCCPNGGGEATGAQDGNSISNRLGSMESAVTELRVMVGVMLALVLLLVLAMVVLFLHVYNKLPKSFAIPILFRHKKNNSDDKNEKALKNNCNGVTPNGTISRLANHQSNSSPQAKRTVLSRSTSVNTDVESQPSPFRVRQPSESTCPEEGNDITPQGYDNLALSTSTINTSTLHNTSNSSTDTLSPTLSTNTLHTTLPSENHLHSNTHHNTRV